jgi:hypothetical protein
VSAGVTFERAGTTQEHEIRAILRDVPLGGAWSIALTREPDGLGGPHLPGEQQDIIIARDTATGAAVGLCERVVRPSWVGGQVVDLPYLGALRIVPSHRHRIAVLRGGFAMLRDDCTHQSDFSVALTSITSDNGPARRLLTAGVRGLPHYTPLRDYSTFALRPRRAPADPAIQEAQDSDGPELGDFLVRALATRDTAPVWSADALRSAEGLRPLVLREGGAITGCIALWDQRAMRQAVLMDCPRWLGFSRAPVNLAFAAARLPAIPARGERIDQAFLSLAATRDECPERFVRLVRAGLSAAQALGVRAAMVGVPSDHPWRAALRRDLRAIEYRTSLFAVVWPEDAAALGTIDPGRVFPEIGLL